MTTSAISCGRTLAILGFHKIGEPPSNGWQTWFYIPEKTFVGYLRHLKDHGWKVIDVGGFLRGLEEPDSLPERAVLLTFDDGYRSLLDVAVPCLCRVDYPSVVFVPTNFIGGHNDFDADMEPEEPICDWAELRELERRGVSVQAHGAAHLALSKLDQAGQEAEFLRSKTILEDGLGKPVEVFSYPFGDNGTDPLATATALARTGYRAACLYGGGPNQAPFTNPFQLSRLAMGPDTDLAKELG
jgi:peptidoglycan/xylan/chitin deacetylase (PgdA/CDA1 family)